MMVKKKKQLKFRFMFNRWNEQLNNAKERRKTIIEWILKSQSCSSWTSFSKHLSSSARKEAAVFYLCCWKSHKYRTRRISKLAINCLSLWFMQYNKNTDIFITFMCGNWSQLNAFERWLAPFMIQMSFEVCNFHFEWASCRYSNVELKV